jgi:actin-related protein
MIWQHIWRQSWNIYKKEKEEYIEHLPLDERNPMAEFLRQLTHKIWIRPSNNALANRRIVIGLLIERCTLEALQTAIRERFIKVSSGISSRNHGLILKRLQHHQQFSLARFTAVSRRRSDRQTFLSA